MCAQAREGASTRARELLDKAECTPVVMFRTEGIISDA